MIDAEELAPVLLAMQGAFGGSKEQVKEIFLMVFYSMAMQVLLQTIH